MTWAIRAITADEAACLPPLLAQVQAIHAEARPDHFRVETDPEEVLAFLRGWLSEDAVTALVAFGPDGAALGYLIVGIETREASALTHPHRRAMLHHIAVDRACRRSGIGSALIEAMKARVRAQGVTRIATTYAVFNAPSAALMRKAGLEPLVIVAEGPA